MKIKKHFILVLLIIFSIFAAGQTNRSKDNIGNTRNRFDDSRSDRLSGSRFHRLRPHDFHSRQFRNYDRFDRFGRFDRFNRQQHLRYRRFYDRRFGYDFRGPYRYYFYPRPYYYYWPEYDYWPEYRFEHDFVQPQRTPDDWYEYDFDN